jgi:hypothetical protein
MWDDHIPKEALVNLQMEGLSPSSRLLEANEGLEWAHSDRVEGRCSS